MTARTRWSPDAQPRCKIPTLPVQNEAAASPTSATALYFPGSPAPKPFHRGHEWLGRMFNDWKVSGVATVGSGRPVNATLAGDANQDGNSTNDRLPGARRNSFLGPDYATTDMRLTRRLYAGDHLKLELVGESFNLLNRDNRRVQITDDGFPSNSARFIQTTKRLGINYFPAQYRVPASFLRATNAYAPRQVQIALRLIF